jgi:CRISPR-associated protein (TIGR03984 family)
MIAQNLGTLLPDPNFVSNQDLKDWVSAQAKQYGLNYMLAHADDGVIWGHFKQGQLTTSDSVLAQSPPLRSITLQQCRIFGAKGEVLLWQVDNTWKARFVGNPQLETIEEPQILWGTYGRECKDDGFTILEDGAQGLRHAVPIVGINFDKDGKTRPVRLLVHHYITYDTDGLARISLSRLLDLRPSPAKEN